VRVCVCDCLLLSHPRWRCTLSQYSPRCRTCSKAHICHGIDICTITSCLLCLSVVGCVQHSKLNHACLRGLALSDALEIGLMLFCAMDASSCLCWSTKALSLALHCVQKTMRMTTPGMEASCLFLSAWTLVFPRRQVGPCCLGCNCASICGPACHTWVCSVAWHGYQSQGFSNLSA